MENQGKDSGRSQQQGQQDQGQQQQGQRGRQGQQGQQGQQQGQQGQQQGQQQAQQGEQGQPGGGQQARRVSGASGPRPIDSGQIMERGRAVLNDARGLASTLEEAFDEIQDYLREQLEQRPYATLAAASGIGYILGGGLPSRLTGLLFGWGSRVALTMAVQQFAPQMSRSTPENAS